MYYYDVVRNSVTLYKISPFGVSVIKNLKNKSRSTQFYEYIY